MVESDRDDQRDRAEFTFVGEVGKVVVDLADGGKSRDPDAELEDAGEEREPEEGDCPDLDYWPGGDDPAEPELSRVGRVAIGLWINRHASRINERANLITQRALDGEDITRDDINRLQAAMEEIEDILKYYAIPVVEEQERNQQQNHSEGQR